MTKKLCILISVIFIGIISSSLLFAETQSFTLSGYQNFKKSPAGTKLLQAFNQGSKKARQKSNFKTIEEVEKYDVDCGDEPCSVDSFTANFDNIQLSDSEANDIGTALITIFNEKIFSWRYRCTALYSLPEVPTKDIQTRINWMSDLYTHYKDTDLAGDIVRRFFTIPGVSFGQIKSYLNQAIKIKKEGNRDPNNVGTLRWILSMITSFDVRPSYDEVKPLFETILTRINPCYELKSLRQIVFIRKSEPLH